MSRKVGGYHIPRQNSYSMVESIVSELWRLHPEQALKLDCDDVFYNIWIMEDP